MGGYSIVPAALVIKILSRSEFIIIIDIDSLCFLYFFAWSLDLEAYQLY